MRKALLGILLATTVASAAYDIKTVDLEMQPTLVLSGTVKTDDEIPQKLSEMFPKIWQYLASKKMQPSGAPFARYFKHDATSIVFEAGFPLSQPMAGEGDIKASSLPAGTTANTTHIGPFEEIGGAYAALHAWMGTNQKTPRSAPWESYVTDPATVPVSELKTEVFYPFK